MKKTLIVLAAVAMISGCASSQTASEETQSGPARVKKCSYERSTSAGSRMERVCRWVDAPADEAEAGD